MSKSKDKKDFSYCNKHAFPPTNGCFYCGWNDEESIARREAAVALKVPMSGARWLDEMIEASLRNDFAKAALQNLAMNSAIEAFFVADEMIAEFKGKKEDM